jgi:hypothetical protein
MSYAAARGAAVATAVVHHKNSRNNGLSLEAGLATHSHFISTCLLTSAPVLYSTRTHPLHPPPWPGHSPSLQRN